MARFDVFLTTDGDQYVLDCQADTLDYFDTRFVVPLARTGSVSDISRLHPVFVVEGETLIMATQLASAISVQELGRKITNLSDHHIEIMDAIDMLLTGY